MKGSAELTGRPWDGLAGHDQRVVGSSHKRRADNARCIAQTATRLPKLFAPVLMALASLASPLQAQQKPAAPIPAAPAFGFVALQVSDLDAAKKFYIDAVGMKQAAVLSRPGDPTQKIGLNFTGDPATGGTLLILIHHADAGPSQPKLAGPIVGILVPDTHAAAARVRAGGFQVLKEPAADAKGPYLTTLVRDPDGVLVELSEVRAVAKP